MYHFHTYNFFPFVTTTYFFEKVIFCFPPPPLSKKETFQKMTASLEDPYDGLQPFIEAERVFAQQQRAGNHDAAVKTLETVLKQNQQFVQSIQDTVLSSLFEKLAVGYNTLGMKYLKLGKTEVSLKFFHKAEAVTDPANLHIHSGTRLVLRAVTYNNLGCFYKSMNKLHTSLQYLKKALVIEERALMNEDGTIGKNTIFL